MDELTPAVGALETEILTQEELSPAESKKWRNALTGIYGVTSLVAALYHKFGLPGLRANDADHLLSPFTENFLHNFLDNIGNNRNGLLAAGLITSAADFTLAGAAEMSESDRAKNILISVRKWMPYALMTIFVISNIDTETIQVLPLSFGDPNINDIPAGLFGILAGSLFFDFFRSTLMTKAFPEQAEEGGFT